jgi:hypothetical protein
VQYRPDNVISPSKAFALCLLKFCSGMFLIRPSGTRGGGVLCAHTITRRLASHAAICHIPMVRTGWGVYARAGRCCTIGPASRLGFEAARDAASALESRNACEQAIAESDGRWLRSGRPSFIDGRLPELETH